MDKQLYDKILSGQKLEKEEAAQLLATPTGSRDYYELLYLANDYSRRTFGGKGLVFAQIGLDMQPCGVNCRFCSMAKDAMCGKEGFVRPLEDAVEEAKALLKPASATCF